MLESFTVFINLKYSFISQSKFSQLKVIFKADRKVDISYKFVGSHCQQELTYFRQIINNV